MSRSLRRLETQLVDLLEVQGALDGSFGQGWDQNSVISSSFLPLPGPTLDNL